MVAYTHDADDESTQTHRYRQSRLAQSNATNAMDDKVRQRRQRNDAVTNGAPAKEEETKATHYAEPRRQKLTRIFFVCLPLLTLLTTLWCCCKYTRYSLEEAQHCNMTVMWFWPTFVEIELPDHASEQYPTVSDPKCEERNCFSLQYRTIVYGEGKYVKSLAQGNFNGTPVLFIPGNAGSDRQVGEIWWFMLCRHDDSVGSLSGISLLYEDAVLSKAQYHSQALQLLRC